jgi:hypothetical protein
MTVVPAVMKIIGECYGVAGPQDSRLPTRKCRLSK